MARQCYVDNLRTPPQPSKEDNISTNIELDPRPLIGQGTKPIEKLKYIPLIDEEHCTQIGERMQGPHRERITPTYSHDNHLTLGDRSERHLPPSCTMHGGQIGSTWKEKDGRQQAKGHRTRNGQAKSRQIYPRGQLHDLHNEKWQICVDYSNLNKACPKDYFPYRA
ncbi:hypothetical protein CR513_39478, partial [Mucuna pruriens]